MSSSAHLPPVKLDAFEGPFDLLIELARKHKVDLAKVSLRQLTDDFLQYIAAKELPPGVQGDFLIVAATLMLLKIRQMLPKLSEEEEQEIASLTDRLKIYQLYRQKALVLAQRWGADRLFPAHFWAADGAGFAALDPMYPELTTVDLRAAFGRVIDELPKPVRPKAHLTIRGRTLQQWLALFGERLNRASELIFQDTVKGTTKQDAAISFLALLEMARKQEITLSQRGTFSRLIVKRP